jgi:hypothetical protein
MGQLGRAADHFKIAASKHEPGPSKFKAEFWQSVTAGEHAAQLKNEKAKVDLVKKYVNESKEADRYAGQTWAKLKPEEQKQMAVAFQEPFEDAIKEIDAIYVEVHDFEGVGKMEENVNKVIERLESLGKKTAKLTYDGVLGYDG